MKFMMECPMCAEVIHVEEDDEKEAMMKMKEMGWKHLSEAHKDTPTMTEEDMEKMIKEKWKSEE